MNFYGIHISWNIFHDVCEMFNTDGDRKLCVKNNSQHVTHVDFTVCRSIEKMLTFSTDEVINIYSFINSGDRFSIRSCAIYNIFLLNFKIAML